MQFSSSKLAGPGQIGTHTFAEAKEAKRLHTSFDLLSLFISALFIISMKELAKFVLHLAA